MTRITRSTADGREADAIVRDLRPQLEGLLARRHNASPGQGSEELLNPYSQEITLGPLESWSPTQRAALERHVGPLRKAIYGGSDPAVTNQSTIC